MNETHFNINNHLQVLPSLFLLFFPFFSLSFFDLLDPSGLSVIQFLVSELFSGDFSMCSGEGVESPMSKSLVLVLFGIGGGASSGVVGSNEFNPCRKRFVLEFLLVGCTFGENLDSDEASSDRGFRSHDFPSS